MNKSFRQLYCVQCVIHVALHNAIRLAKKEHLCRDLMT